MSFTGKFIIEGESEHPILDVQISMKRSVDANGRPNGLPTGGMIKLTIACPDTVNPFWGWMVNPQSTKDGSIEYKSEQGQTYPNIYILQCILRGLFGAINWARLYSYERQRCFNR